MGGYLNFHCNFNAFADIFYRSVQDHSYFSKQLISPTKEIWNVEYSQPNTHKALHVGHLRGLVLGDALCNLLSYLSIQVIRTTYPGDFGAHVAKTLWYLSHPSPKAPPKENKAKWLGEKYAQADEAYKKLKGTDEEAKVKKIISEILFSLSKQEGPYYELWKETREWSLDELKSIYSWLRCQFDVWYFESQCEESSIKLVKQKFQEGFFVQDQGAIGIDLSQWKLGFALFLKSDGNGLYLTKDLELLFKKFSNTNVTKLIYIVDSRQKLHFQQLFKTAELLGFSQAKDSEHLAYETVNTPEGTPFSSRQINGTSLLELKSKMEEKVTNDYLERYRGHWKDEEIAEQAKNVTIGAIKYGMLKVDSCTQVKFSLEEWLRLDGETGPYLQYVHARCHSILEKITDDKNSEKTFALHEKNEQELLYSLSRFNEIVLTAALQHRPHQLACYLYDVCKIFNRFYESSSIKNATGNIRYTRLALVDLTKTILNKGLEILGIPAPLKM
ncbi:MAG: arginine--tRNA ligase, partial [Silvanigrellaceae bacterium]|nr:arginine--tRNA ligase [Silvanigrellaceae bacterium]